MDYCFGFGSASISAAGYLSDLREIIAKYMRRELPDGRLNTHSVMEYARDGRRGEWVELDGRALKIRCYKKGTMHIEVHPQIAWRLNRLLHELHPAAIPHRFREPPKRTKKMPDVHDRPLSFACLRVLADGYRTDNTWSLGYGDTDKAARKEAEAVLAQLGGIKTGGGWEFDYNPKSVLREILASGVIPDKLSHQFYPTPSNIAEAVLEEAEITSSMRVLEPSAGTGGLIREIPASCPTDAIEVSALNCRALESLKRPGLSVTCADFMEWPGGEYERVLMNPPYSEGRAEAHLEKALTHLAPGGRLVAVLPSTFKRREFSVEGRWGQVFERFPGTSISVALYIVDRPAD
jgi:hypothetical protein